MLVTDILFVVDMLIETNLRLWRGSIIILDKNASTIKQVSCPESQHHPERYIMVETSKNPYAVAVGERIKQSRRMAGLENVEKLLELIPGWSDKRSRLTNYEAGISLAPPEVILDIARATDCSECWLMFGSGPIRSTGRDLQAIRHQNLVYVVEQARDSKRFKTLLSSLGLSPPKMEEMIANPFIPISDRLARRSEQFIKKPVRWMDEQHIENDPVCQSFPDDMRELMSIYSDLPTTMRSIMLEIARTIRSHSP